VILGFFLCVKFIVGTVFGGVQRILYSQNGEKIVVYKACYDIIEGSGHAPYRSQPALFTELLREALSWFRR
jgi:hypothetical protein